jgi:hypothetical protein
MTANAGPDQTVSGPNPVDVQFDGSGSTGDIVAYRWYNQWGELRAEGESPVIEVNFGHENPQPGTTRKFRLVVEDVEGNTDGDEVVITLGKGKETPPKGSPCSCNADAGPDQTVPGPSPVEVFFNGSNSDGVSYKWYNQFGELRAEGQVARFELNFGADPKPGATRTFTLVVEDEEGNTDKDEVVITLSENPIQGDPLIGSAFSGTTFYFDDFRENLTAGFLTDEKKWYVGIGVPDNAATKVECHFGIFWQADEDANFSTGSDIGCVGDLEVISRDPGIYGVMEPTPIYEGDLITGWEVRMFDSSVATITFGGEGL